MKKSVILVILLFSLIFFLLFIFMNNIIIVNDPLSEKEIISYVQKQIYNETGDNVIVKIKEKSDLKVGTSWFDSCIRYQKVDKGYSYVLEITNVDNSEIVALGT